MARTPDLTEHRPAVIVGSAFDTPDPIGAPLEARHVDTPWGPHPVFETEVGGRRGLVAFRHGRPHRRLPHQIDYRAQAWALQHLGCTALLVTTSAGVLDPALPLFEPLWISDVLMLDNRLPDGSACTMFLEPRPDHGHLVVEDGLISSALMGQMDQVLGEPLPRAVFAYNAGPRTKTAAENAMWAQLGAQINSMSVGPEVVLANELQIACLAVAVGHKHSHAGADHPRGRAWMAASLERSHARLVQVVRAFLSESEPVPFGNHVFRFGEP